MKFKRMKPLRGLTRLERLAGRIRTEEQLLEILDKELPEERLAIFKHLAPHLRFRLSPGFDPARLSESPYTGPRERLHQTAKGLVEAAERTLAERDVNLRDNATPGRALFNPERPMPEDMPKRVRALLTP